MGTGNGKIGRKVVRCSGVRCSGVVEKGLQTLCFGLWGGSGDLYMFNWVVLRCNVFRGCKC